MRFRPSMQTLESRENPTPIGPDLIDQGPTPPPGQTPPQSPPAPTPPPAVPPATPAP